MNHVTNHERPGVYSTYDASSLIRSGGGSKTVGLAAKSAAGEAGRLYRFSRWEEAETTFGPGDAMTELVTLLFRNGAGAVYAVPVAEDDYTDAFALLAGTEGIDIQVCDSIDTAVWQALRDSVAEASQARRERIAVVGAPAGKSAAELAQLAQEINSERVILVAPPEPEGSAGRIAAAVAGAIAGERDPAVPLSGAVLSGLSGLSARYADSEIDVLVRGGVTPLEEVAGAISVVRGVTTRTKTGEAEDATWRELNTILIVDDVIPTIRQSLRARFQRAKNTQQTRGAIRSQVVMELENKLSREIITGYGDVAVTADSENPTVCLVEFSFTVTHGLNQIWLTAHITV